MKKEKKKLIIKDFCPVIAWSEIEQKLGKRDYKKFVHWMRGQTCTEAGVYIGDLDKFLRWDYQGTRMPDILWD